MRRTGFFLCGRVEGNRLLLGAISKILKLNKASAWAKVSKKELVKHGAKPLLKEYGSIRSMLQELAPDMVWDPFEVGKYPNKHWDQISNLREFMDKMKQKYSITKDSDWKNITWNHITKHGGATLRAKYSSFPCLLQAAYPEKHFNPLDICQKLPQNYWDNPDNRKNYILLLKEHFNIQSSKDWQKVNTSDLSRLGGSGFLAKYPSFDDLLRQEVFDDTKPISMRNRVPVGYWTIENIRKTMDDIGNEIGVQKLDDWKHVSVKTITERCGNRAFLSYYPSFFDLLKEIYPHHNWKEDEMNRHPSKYWKKKENHQKFLHQFARKYSLTSPEHWKNISCQQIVQEGGRSVLRSYSSMYQMLQNNFPEYEWKIENVKESPKDYWRDRKSELIQKIKEKYDIQVMEDWYRISNAHLCSVKAASFIKRQGGLGKLLTDVYPDYPWEMWRFKSKQKKARQREMFVRLKELFPMGEEIVEEFVHPHLLRKSGNPLELDVFLPNQNIAFEYQGEHHYEENSAYGSMEMYKERDEEKVALCSHHNIALVIVPYSWDGTTQHLQYFMQSQLRANVPKT